jgi:hypothetical protein
MFKRPYSFPEALASVKRLTKETKRIKSIGGLKQDLSRLREIFSGDELIQVKNDKLP